MFIEANSPHHFRKFGKKIIYFELRWVLNQYKTKYGKVDRTKLNKLY